VSRKHPITLQKMIFCVSSFCGHAQLAAELEPAVGVEPYRIPPDVVTMDSRVRFEDKSTGEIRDVTIVFPSDANATGGKASVLATVGIALLGVAVGHSIPWLFPDGTTRSETDLPSGVGIEGRGGSLCNGRW